MQFIDLHKQYEQIEAGVKAGLERILEHKAFIGGPEVKKLEEQLAEYAGVKHAICCASGTDALTIPLMAYGVKKEDAIFVPSFTFFASAESVSLAGATPVFVDSNEVSFNIDTVDLEEKILKVKEEGKLNPKGIIAVDLFGLPADFAEIRRIADKYGLFLIEDAAQGFGGSINGKKACSFGDVAGTSFFPAKPLGCYGDGGAIFTNDDELAKIIRSIHVHGQGADKYDNVRIGLNSRLDSMQAAILIEKLSIFDDELVKRDKVAQWYTEELSGVVETPVVPEGYTSAWAQYTLKAKSLEQRQEIIEKMKEKGIPVMIYYPIPIHKSGAYKDTVSWNVEKCETLSDVVFSLPMHPYLEKEEVVYICDELKKIIG